MARTRVPYDVHSKLAHIQGCARATRASDPAAGSCTRSRVTFESHIALLLPYTGTRTYALVRDYARARIVLESTRSSAAYVRYGTRRASAFNFFF
jgi:hypothetical protein